VRFDIGNVSEKPIHFYLRSYLAILTNSLYKILNASLRLPEHDCRRYLPYLPWLSGRGLLHDVQPCLCVRRALVQR
jgi:hypothetical protein